MVVLRMKVMLYKERGGVNWFLCKVIAEYNGKIWIHNIHTGSMPIKNRNSIELKNADDYIKELNTTKD